jgi:signal transduction histidine kinase
VETDNPSVTIGGEAAVTEATGLALRSLRYPSAGLAVALSEVVGRTNCDVAAAFLVGRPEEVELLAAVGRSAAALGGRGPAPAQTRLVRDFGREASPRSTPPPPDAGRPWADHAWVSRICTPLTDEENVVLVLAGDRSVEAGELSDLSTAIAILVRIDLLAGEVDRLRAELHRTRQDRSLLAAGLEHDLRTPLTAIMGAAMILRDNLDKLPGQERAQVLDMVVSQSRRLTAMLEDALSRATEGGDAPVVIRRVQLDELAERAAGAARLAREGEVLIDVPATMVPTDPERLERGLLNLLDNALKFSPPSSPVHLVAERTSSGWVLTVADSGPGVPEDLVPSLFTPHATGSERGEGFGLGLYSVNKLVSELGGNVTYARRDGWTRFSILLPHKVASSAEDETTTE